MGPRIVVTPPAAAATSAANTAVSRAIADVELLVPLQPEHEGAVRSLDRLDHAVLGVRDRPHLGAEPVDRLVVVRVDRSGAARAAPRRGCLARGARRVDAPDQRLRRASASRASARYRVRRARARPGSGCRRRRPRAPAIRGRRRGRLAVGERGACKAEVGHVGARASRGRSAGGARRRSAPDRRRRRPSAGRRRAARTRPASSRDRPRAARSPRVRRRPRSPRARAARPRAICESANSSVTPMRGLADTAVHATARARGRRSRPARR